MCEEWRNGCAGIHVVFSKHVLHIPERLPSNQLLGRCEPIGFIGVPIAGALRLKLERGRWNGTPVGLKSGKKDP